MWPSLLSPKLLMSSFAITSPGKLSPRAAIVNKEFSSFSLHQGKEGDWRNLSPWWFLISLSYCFRFVRHCSENVGVFGTSEMSTSSSVAISISNCLEVSILETSIIGLLFPAPTSSSSAFVRKLENSSSNFVLGTLTALPSLPFLTALTTDI